MPDYCRALLGDSRPKSGDVGVVWGQEWDQKSSSIARAASSRISSRTWAYLLRSSRGRPGRASGRPCGAGRLGARSGCRRCDEGRGSGRLPGGWPPQGTPGEPPEGAHHRVAPADLAFCVREDQARVVGPGGGGHAFLALSGAVCLEDLDGAEPDTDLAFLAGSWWWRRASSCGCRRSA
jgi:hypothetical protein